MTIQPYPFQKEGVRGIEYFGGRCLLADDPGLGKTLQALWCLRRNQSWLPAVVVCPASVKYVWEREAAAGVGMRVNIASGTKPPDQHMRLSADPSITVINYDILKDWTGYLIDAGVRTVIYDECQNLISISTNRTKAARKLATVADRVMGLSGTPLTNRPAELWPILNMIQPREFKRRLPFLREFCNPQLKPWGWEFKGATNLDVLHQRLIDILMIRRRKEDVLHQLPKKTTIVQNIQMRRPEEYERASRDLIGWLRETRAERVRSAKRAEKMVRVGYLLRLAAKLKAKYAVQSINGFLRKTDKKLVVFAVHRPMIRTLQKRLCTKTVTIDGSTRESDRGNAILQFQCDPRTRVFIGNIKAAGTGIDGLQKVASDLVFVEMWWTPGAMTQVADRIHRIGQHDPVRIRYLVAGGTIEEKLCEVLQRKQAVIRTTLDGGVMPDDLNIFDQLMLEIKKG